MEDVEHGSESDHGSSRSVQNGRRFMDDVHPTIALEREINVQDLLSDKGTDFQIKDPGVDVTNDDDWDVDGFDDDEEYEEPSDVTESLNQFSKGQDDAGDGLTPFQRLAEKMENITDDGKVKKKILRAGVGPVVPERSIVRVHYSGRLEYASEPFDSSYFQSRDRPRSFKLGDGTLLPGLDITVGTMRRDEICHVLIHPDYFMGKLGCAPRIPPEATVLFQIELVSFSDRSGVHDYYDLPMSERKEAPIETILQVVKIEKGDAKKLFGEKRYRQALRKYKRAIDILEDCHLADEDAEQKQRADLIVLYRNAAACSNKLSEANRTIYYAKQAININPKDCKSWFLKGKGLAQQSEFDHAKDAFMRAKRIEPNNTEIAKALKDLDTRFKQFDMMERATCRRMFSNSNNASPKEDAPSSSGGAAKFSAVVKADPLSDVSDEFREETRKQFLLFKENTDMEELPYPSSRLTNGELRCLLDTARELGLTVQEIGEGSNHHYRFKK